MVSINRQRGYGRVFHDVRCLSTDEKPTEGIKNGSTLVEIDTGETFLFDAEAGVWNAVDATFMAGQYGIII